MIRVRIWDKCKTQYALRIRALINNASDQKYGDFGPKIIAPAARQYIFKDYVSISLHYINYWVIFGNPPT